MMVTPLLSLINRQTGQAFSGFTAVAATGQDSESGYSTVV